MWNAAFQTWKIRDQFKAALAIAGNNEVIVPDVQVFRRSLAESLQNKPAASEQMATSRAMQLAKDSFDWVRDECSIAQQALDCKTHQDAQMIVDRDTQDNCTCS